MPSRICIFLLIVSMILASGHAISIERRSSCRLLEGQKYVALDKCRKAFPQPFLPKPYPIEVAGADLIGWMNDFCTNTDKIRNCMERKRSDCALVLAEYVMRSVDASQSVCDGLLVKRSVSNILQRLPNAEIRNNPCFNLTLQDACFKEAVESYAEAHPDFDPNDFGTGMWERETTILYVIHQDALQCVIDNVNDRCPGESPVLVIAISKDILMTPWLGVSSEMMFNRFFGNRRPN